MASVMTAVVFQMQLPTTTDPYIISVKQTRSEATWELVISRGNSLWLETFAIDRVRLRLVEQD